MIEGAEVPAETVAEMRNAPFWPSLEGMAHTLVYEAEIMAGGSLPTERAAAVTVPKLVMGGEKSPAWMRQACPAVADAIPDARYCILEGPDHGASPEALAPALEEFFTGGDAYRNGVGPDDGRNVGG